jgi:8-oxo-dGTP diphosphatase
MPFSYDYPRPALTVDAVVFRKSHGLLEVLLIRRKHNPFKGMWALPGGFIDMEETVEEAVVRELEEETHLKVEGLQQLHTFSALNRDPRGRTVSVTFLGWLIQINHRFQAAMMQVMQNGSPWPGYRNSPSIMSKP